MVSELKRLTKIQKMAKEEETLLVSPCELQDVRLYKKVDMPMRLDVAPFGLLWVSLKLLYHHHSSHVETNTIGLLLYSNTSLK